MALVLAPENPGQLERGVALLRANLPIGLPTETVYGLAARAFEPTALARIFALKARPTFDPLIVHVLHREQAQACVKGFEPLHLRLMEKFWPGPLTFLAQRSERIPDLCTAGSAWVALRSPVHPVFRRVLEQLDEPLAAPSANRFGRLSPVSAEDVVQDLGPFGLEAVVDGGTCALGIESTIVRVADGNSLEVLRPGSLSVEALRECLGNVEVRVLPRTDGVAAPGLLASHYAPRLPLVFLPDVDTPLPRELRPERWVAVSVFPSDLSRAGWRDYRVLSEISSDKEAAAKLFGTLRALDGSGADGIVALGAPPAGLGLAINDRLKRAAAPRSEPL